MIKNIIIAVLALALAGGGFMYLKRRGNATHITKNQVYESVVGIADTNGTGYLLLSTGTEEVLNKDFAKGARTQGHIMITDMMGKTIFDRDVLGGVGDFRQWVIDNKVYYTYGTSDTIAYRTPKVDKRLTAGAFHLLDSAMNEIRTFHLLPHGDLTTDRHEELDFHDFILLGENHYIAYSCYEKTPGNIPAYLQAPKNKSVIACIVQEVKDGKVLWQWDASKYPEFYDNVIFKEEFKDSMSFDYLHANAIALDPKDSNIVISFRRIDQIIKLQRGTGSILWRLGGRNSDFPLLDEQRFIGQHGVKYNADKETMQFLDNGDAARRPFSRLVEFKLDEQNKKVTSYYSYKIPHQFTYRRGNVMNIGDKYLICGGFGRYLLIVDPKTDKYIFESQIKGNFVYYRAYWVDNIHGLDQNKKVAQN